VSAADERRHVFVRGRVQGVGFRAWVAEEARQRGLRGAVRNRRNGDVEAVFIGNAETVATMVEACREGPPAARVTAVEVLRSGLANELGPLAGELFSVLPTL